MTEHWPTHTVDFDAVEDSPTPSVPEPEEETSHLVSGMIDVSICTFTVLLFWYVLYFLPSQLHNEAMASVPVDIATADEITRLIDESNRARREGDWETVATLQGELLQPGTCLLSMVLYAELHDLAPPLLGAVV